MRVAYSLVFILLALVIVAPAFAEVSRSIAVQGVLKNSAGVSLSGPYDVQFEIFNYEAQLPICPDPEVGCGEGEFGSPALFSQTKEVIASNGLFSTTLDDTEMQLMFDTDYWLQITVGGETLSPRQRLTAAPYALGMPGIMSDGSYVTIPGRLGIGILGSDPLTVGGAITSQNYNAYGIKIDGPNTNGPMLSFLNSDYYRTPFLVIGSYANKNRINTTNRNFSIFSTADPVGVNYIANTGNVGIGTTNPATSLQIEKLGSGSTQTLLTLSNPGTAANTGIGVNFVTNNSGFSAGTISVVDIGGGYNSQMQFVTKGGGVWQYPLTLKTGNVGIGTTSPTQKLDINASDSVGLRIKGTIGNLIPIIDGNQTVAIGYYRNGTSKWQVGVGAFGASDNFVFGSGSYKVATFEFNASADSLYIKQNGNVGIGTTTPLAKLDVNGSANINGNLTLNGSITIPAMMGVKIGGLLIAQNPISTVQNVVVKAMSGQLQPGTYCYYITANVTGRESEKREACASITGSTIGWNISWSPVASATYNVYGRNDTSVGLIKVVSGKTYFEDNGTLSPNTAIKPPAGGILTDLSGAGTISADTLKYKALLQVGNNSPVAYQTSTMRYIVEAGPANVGVVVPINSNLMDELCRDKDGCRVTLEMINWDAAGKPGLVTAQVNGIYMSETSRWWRTVDSSADRIDNDVVSNEWNVNDCYLTDAETSTNTANGRSDNAVGFGLLNADGNYNDATTICRVIFED